MPTIHELKIWPEFYEAIESCVKTFDLRKDDRGYEINDGLRFREWDPRTEQYTGYELSRTIVYILRHRPKAGCAATFGLQPGYVILGLD